MKHLSPSLLAILFLLQACGEDPPKPTKPASPTEAIQNITRKLGTPAADAAANDAGPKDAAANDAGPNDMHAPLPREHVVRFYNALWGTAKGQDALTGTCGNFGEYFNRSKQKRKRINVQLPFEGCQVGKVTIDGKLKLAAARNAKGKPEAEAEAARVQGTLIVQGELTGTCEVELNYPADAVFEMQQTVAPESADLGLVDPAQLSGKMCGVDIAEVIKDADIARAQAGVAKAQAPQTDAIKAVGDALKAATKVQG